MHWFDDGALVRQLPPPFRLYAGYMRLAVDRRTGLVRGGSFLHRVLSRAGPLLRLPRIARVRLNGLAVHLDLRDPRMFWVLGEVRGETPEARALSDLLGPGDTFLDIGANHGSYALLAARLVGPQGVVLAYEPQPLLAELVRRSFEANGFSHARLEQVACSDRAGTARFFVPRENSGAAGVYPALSGAGKAVALEVRNVTLDAAVDPAALPGRLVVKLDVEGAELAAIRGARGLLSARRPPIVLEISSATSAAAGHRVADLVDELRRLGYARYAEIDALATTSPLGALSSEPQRNVVVLP
jgi:FkbM family methyltransferase